MEAPDPLFAMSGCCALVPATLSDRPRVDPAFVRRLDEDSAAVDFLIPDMHCAACIGRIEDALAALPGVTAARADLTARRVGVRFAPGRGRADAMLATLEGLGYAARPFDAAAFDAASGDAAGDELLRAVAVAGFAAGNVMLLSVSVWSGAEAATRDLFHWLSALIALPAIVYSGRTFFRSAWAALAARRLNMDVPISVGVILTAAMSLFETGTGGRHAWFDAAVMLLFLLLVGRLLDHRMRTAARSAAARLAALAARSALRLGPDGTVAHVPIAEIAPGDRIRVAAGDRIPVDGVVVDGVSDTDRSLLTGESEPVAAAPGGAVYAGTMNLTGPLTVRATVAAGETLLAEIARMMAEAEQAGSRRVRLADRVTRFYAPVVHGVALLTALGWLAAGAGLHTALLNAVAVLIITCPCALGLAVPAVQVVASGHLFRRGVMLKDGGALERLATVDRVVLDKTGTLTEGRPVLAAADPRADAEAWSVAAALAGTSRHPLARALAAAAPAASSTVVEAIAERPGAGLEGMWQGRPVRLGSRADVGADAGADVGAEAAPAEGTGSEIWLRIGDDPPLRFAFVDRLRADARAVVAGLRQRGLGVSLLSGDRAGAVSSAAAAAGIDDWQAGRHPGDKVAALAAETAAGYRVMMVGDGINDAPALAAAAVSMSPAGAADIARTAADIVFTGRGLAPVLLAFDTATAARRLIVQNFAMAIAYNLLAVPLAVAGYATPLIAAAMSVSSILVTANALSLPFRTGPRTEEREKRDAAPMTVAGEPA